MILLATFISKTKTKNKQTKKKNQTVAYRRLQEIMTMIVHVHNATPKSYIRISLCGIATYMQLYRVSMMLKSSGSLSGGHRVVGAR